MNQGQTKAPLGWGMLLAGDWVKGNSGGKEGWRGGGKEFSLGRGGGVLGKEH